MLQFFKNGGFPMFFILFFGATTLVTAFWFAMRPSDQHEGFIKLMGRATLYATLSGPLAAFPAVVRSVVTHGDQARAPAAVLRRACAGAGACTPAPSSPAGWGDGCTGTTGAP